MPLPSLIYSAFMLLPLSWGTMAVIATLLVACSTSFLTVSIGTIHKVPYGVRHVAMGLLPALTWVLLIFMDPIILYQRNILIWHVLGGATAAGVLLPMFLNTRAVRWSLPLSLCVSVGLYWFARSA